jgi:hypothetical protein
MIIWLVAVSCRACASAGSKPTYDKTIAPVQVAKIARWVIGDLHGAAWATHPQIETRAAD